MKKGRTMQSTAALFTPEDMLRSRQVFAEERDMAKRMRELCVFGAGRTAKWVRERFAQDGYNTVRIVDNNPALQGKTLDGITVVSPSEFAGDGRPLVAAVGAANMPEVLRQCREMGITAVPFYKAMAILRVGCFTSPLTAEEIETQPGARTALDAWADAESKDKYIRFLKFHALRDDSLLAAREPEQYFNPRYMPRGFLRSVADVGAYDGDTLRQFLALTGGDFDNYYACEPDPEFFAALRATCDRLGDSRIRPHKLAIGDVPGEFGMRKAAASSSMLAGNGNLIVRVDTLEHLLDNAPVTLIKMDIEGAEPGALRGSEGVIRSQRPALAISVYHQVSHFWEIPLWIRELGLGYSLKLGCHSDSYNEAICYAIPE